MSSRRNFLKLAGASAGALAAAKLGIKPAVAQGDIPWGDFVRLSQLSWNDLYGNPPALGRVGQGVVCVNFDGSPAAGLKVFRGPSTSSGIVRKVCAHYVAPIYAAVRGEPYDARSWSDVWYYIGPNEDGQDEYLHSAFVIPTREVLNQPEEVTDWFWGEVTVPIAYQFKSPSFNAWYDFDYYKVFYGQVHQILESATDDAGNVWYRIYDDIEPDRPAWVLAQTFRRITPAEFEPINPQVQDKVIEIDLGRQTITCLEEGYPVFRTRIASGTVYNAPDGTPIDFSTPYGDYVIQGKRPSRRMRGGEEFNLAYDVNAVPWVTYFSFTGAAIHGAYWHNNYGVPRSHGCINVTPDAGKWIYRWSQPYVSYEYVSRLTNEELTDQPHTPITVI